VGYFPAGRRYAQAAPACVSDVMMRISGDVEAMWSFHELISGASLIWAKIGRCVCVHLRREHATEGVFGEEPTILRAS
jgi:hypothetical protein